VQAGVTNMMLASTRTPAGPFWKYH